MLLSRFMLLPVGFCWLVLPLGAAQPLPQFDGNLRRLDVQSDGSLLMLRGPGQPRLDSGSPSAGWFPLPDAVARAFGLPPICPYSPSSMSLEQLWVSIDCKQVVTMDDNWFQCLHHVDYFNHCKHKMVSVELCPNAELTSLIEGFIISSFDVIDKMNKYHDVAPTSPGHHQLQATLGVELGGKQLP